MLKLLTITFAFIIFTGCKGDKGDIGPQGTMGPVGATGATGARGPAGTNGTNGVDALAATYEDFTADVSKLGSFQPKSKIEANEFIFVFINDDGIINPLPFRGYASTTDKKDFVKLDCTYSYLTYTLYIDNDTVVPPGATFSFRLVRIKGTKAGRIRKDISYEELKQICNI